MTRSSSADDEANPLTGVNRAIVPFLACGDLSAFDSDRTYPIHDPEYVALAPAQAPIAPPYAEALARRRAGEGQEGTRTATLECTATVATAEVALAGADQYLVLDDQVV